MEEEKRRVRINRLKEMKFQLAYINLFVRVINENIKNDFKDHNEKIKYYATAYNSGFWFNEEKNDNFSLLFWRQSKAYKLRRTLNRKINFGNVLSHTPDTLVKKKKIYWYNFWLHKKKKRKK